MDNKLFDTAIKFSNFAKQNIVFIAEPSTAFATLIDEDSDADLATISSKKARLSISGKEHQSNFYYTTAIEYPFATKPHMNTRYSDGSYPVWYGSQEIETTLYETLHYALLTIQNSDGLERDDKIVRKRTVYNIYCDAVLIDLSDKRNEFPELVTNNYQFTHTIGKKIQEDGYPGLLSPSARHPKGINLNIFKKEILSKPSILHQLTYTINPNQESIVVTGVKDELTFKFNDIM